MVVGEKEYLEKRAAGGRKKSSYKVLLTLG
jgi:hypothetical protein